MFRRHEKANARTVSIVARSSRLQRTLDRYVGIPAVALVGLVRSRGRYVPRSVTRIGLIQPSAIGDMFLISGLVAHLHKLYPAAEVHVFHSAFNSGAVPFLVPDAIGHRCDFNNPRAALRELRASRLDVLINCAPWTRTHGAADLLVGRHGDVWFSFERARHSSRV